MTGLCVTVDNGLGSIHGYSTNAIIRTSTRISVILLRTHDILLNNFF